LKEQGQLICQDEFLVSFRKKKCFRHIFLFQDLVLFSKTKRTDVGNDTYVYKQSFKVCRYTKHSTIYLNVKLEPKLPVTDPSGTFIAHTSPLFPLICICIFVPFGFHWVVN
jgi:hypothetical protein